MDFIPELRCIKKNGSTLFKEEPFF